MKRLRRRGLALVLSTVVWLVGVGSARAADSTRPHIDHIPVREGISDTALRVSAGVADNESVRRVTLFVRAAGTISYYAIPMKFDATEYAAMIPARLLTVGTLEYYIEAIDTSGNIATSPAVAASGNPYRVAVSKDDTIPSVSLRGPVGSVGDEGFLVVLVFADAGDNVDPNSVRLIFNGRDVTSRARISARAARFLAQAYEVKSLSSLQVRVSDRAGNETVRMFRIYQRPLVSGDLSLEVGSNNGEPVLNGVVNFGASWGAFSAYGEVRSSESVGGEESDQPKDRFTLVYESRPFELSVGDVFTTLSPLSANGYSHRGYNAQLKLGVFDSRLAGGISAQPIEAEAYARKFLGTRQAIEFGAAELGVNAVSLVDDDVPGIQMNPQQNYVLSVDGATEARGIRVRVEAGASLTFPNARGNVWESLDELAESGKPYDRIAEYLGNVPVGLRPYMPLPHPNYWIIDPPYLDAGFEMNARTTLPHSTLSARYFRIGPDFRTIAGAATSDREGYSARWASQRLMDGALRLTASYESFEDSVQSLLSALAGRPAPSGRERSRFTTIAGGVNLRTEGQVYIEVTGKREETNGDRSLHQILADQNKSRTDSVGVRVGNLRYLLGSFNGRINLRLGQSDFADLVNRLNDKATTTVRVSTILRRGPWSYELGAGSKREVDAIGASVSSPSVNLGTAWSGTHITVAGVRLDRVQAEVRTVLGQTKGLNQDTQTQTYSLVLRLFPTTVSRWTAQLRAKRIVDKLENIDDKDVMVLLRYVYLF